jgi:hypothetical protein
MTQCDKSIPGRSLTILLALALVSGVPGCGFKHFWDSNRPNFAILDRNLTAQGATALVEEPSFEDVDIAKVIGPPPTAISVAASASTPGLDERLIQFRQRCQTPGTDCTFDRNSIQERLIAASNQRCGKYQTFLKQFDAEGNFVGKTTSIVLSGLGAVFPAASTARALSGAAAIVQGTNVVFNEAFFNKLAAQVITEGIDARRAEVYTAIRARQTEGVTSYPLEAAIGDAIRYHASCTTMAGLQYAADAVQKQKEKQATDIVERNDGAVRAQSAVASTETSLQALKKDIETIVTGKTLKDDQGNPTEIGKQKDKADKAVDDALNEVAGFKTEVALFTAKAAELLGQIRIAGDDSQLNVHRAEFELNVSRAQAVAAKAESALTTAAAEVTALREVAK